MNFRTEHGKFICAEDGGGAQGVIVAGRPAGLLVANRPSAGVWETFTVERIDSAHYAFRSHDGHYVCAESGGGHILVANRAHSSPGPWEIFRIIVHADGRVTLQAHNGAYVCAELDGSLIANRFDIGSWECFTPSEPFVVAAQAFVHPNPMIGQFTTIGDTCFADQNGPRVANESYHGGDLFMLFVAGFVSEVRAVLAEVAKEGYPMVRSWVCANDSGDPTNVWAVYGRPKYIGCGPTLTAPLKNYLAGFARLLGEFDLVWHLAPGGLDGMDRTKEEQLFRDIRDAVTEVGAERFGVIEACNEARDTCDGNGNPGDDNSPEHLLHLINIVRTRHPQILYILTSWTGTDYPDLVRPYNPLGVTRFAYAHQWRGGNIHDKIRHRFTWGHENGFRRLTADGEACGPWNKKGIPGNPLTCVSAQDNDHEFDDESVAAIAMATVIGRGWPSFMCSTGVMHYVSPSAFPGFSSIPRLLAQIPKDAHTGRLVHGGQSSAIIAATTNTQGHIGRADQLLLSDGRIVALLYASHDGTKGEQKYRFLFRQGLDGVLVHPGTGEAHPIRLNAGQTLDISMKWARVFVGRAS